VPDLFPYRIAGFRSASGGKQHASADSKTDSSGKTDYTPERVTLVSVNSRDSIAEVRYPITHAVNAFCGAFPHVCCDAVGLLKQINRGLQNRFEQLVHHDPPFFRSKRG
jgi:hypothetical protein